MRRHVRPWFQRTRALRLCYDSITFACTRIAIAYLGFSFLVLELYPVLAIYRLVLSLVCLELYPVLAIYRLVLSLVCL